MLLLNKLKSKHMTFYNIIERFTNSFLLFPFVKVLKPNLRNSLVDSKLQLLKLGSLIMVEPFKLQQATI